MSFNTEVLRDDLVAAGGTDFAFTFPIFTEDDIHVFRNGVQAVKNIDYQVRSGGVPFNTLPATSLPATGFIRFLIAPANGTEVALVPHQPNVQTSEYTLEPYPADRIEKDFDKAGFVSRMLREQMARAIKLTEGSVLSNIPIDDPVPDLFLVWDPTGTRITSTPGIPGPQGPQGETGPQGPIGPQGPTGTGAPGSTWFADPGVPSSALGLNGDFYLNETNGDVYQKVTGAWVIQTNIRGPIGLTGPAGPSGATIPVALPGALGISGTNNNTTPATKYDITFTHAVLANPSDGTTVGRFNSTTFTCDATVQGRNGRDQAGAFTTPIWLYLYATWDGATLATRFSASPPPTGPALANGETHWAFLCALRYAAGPSFFLTYTRKNWTYYRTPQALISATFSLGSEQSIFNASFVHPVASRYTVQTYGTCRASTNTQAAEYEFALRLLAGTTFSRGRLGITGSTDANAKQDGIQMENTLPNTGYLGAIWNAITAITAGTITLTTTVEVMGYENF